MSRPFILVLVVLFGCGPGASREGSTGEPAETGGALEAVTEPVESASWVAVRAPRDRALLDAPARTLAGIASIEHVAASFPLRVVRVYVQPGDVVEAGAPIVDVTSRDVLTAAADYQSTTAGLVIHDRRLAELRALHDERVVSAERVYEIETRRAELIERQRAAVAVLRAAGLAPGAAGGLMSRGVITLSASVGGVIRDLHAIVGEVHADGQVFATIIAGPSVRVEARFAQALGDGFEYTFEDLRGRATLLGRTPTRTLDAGDDGGIYVWFDVPVSAALAPDAPGHVHAKPVDARFIEVPIGALAPMPEGPRVMRRRAGVVAPIAVTVAASSGTSTIVVGDLRLGDEVASDGAALLVPVEPGGAE